jgi:hypothetical protein
LISSQTPYCSSTNHLSDIAAEIMEVTTKPKNTKFQFQTVAVNGQIDEFDCAHCISIIRLKHGGGQYAIDLTGAQYGYYEPIIPFGKYLKDRAMSVYASQSFGTREEKMLREGSEISLTGSVYRLNAMTYPAMELGAKQWEKDRGIDTMSFLKLSEEKFCVAAKEVLTAVELSLKIQIELMRKEAAKAITSNGHKTLIIRA